MMETLGLLIAGVAGLFGHVKSKDFVSRRLRYTKVAERSAGGMALLTGAATSIVAAPVVAVLPVFGTGAALLLGLGVGTGVGMGIVRARDG
ncbi:MAG: hypothetical protein OXG58_03790 [Gemmatimonadetes bacterium]|nr:hypothetical protein [Gemmatimonadota bacterium]MCY3944102.1 hypothetical protein [Gemmatimonadota bacterium]